MGDPALFKWRHFQADLILCAVRWYLRDALSDRDVEELLRERGISVDHTTVFRWVQCYAPELDESIQIWGLRRPRFILLDREIGVPTAEYGC